MKRREALKGMSLAVGTLATNNIIRTAQAADKKYTVALVMKALSNPFFHAMEVGAREEAEKLGIDLLVQGTNKETDINQQISIVQNCITRKVNAIVIAPISSTGMVPILFQAQKQGVYVVNIDNPLDEKTMKSIGLAAPFVGSDNALGAALAVHDLIAAMGGAGEAAILEGMPGVVNAQLRTQGAMRIFNEEPTIKVVASQTAEWETETAFQIFTNMLAAHPNIKGLFAANDNMALGAIRAIAAAKKDDQIAVTSYDNLKAAQEAVLAGSLHSTIDQHPELMGAYGVRAAKDHLDGKEVPDYIPTPLEVIDYRALSMKK